MNGTAPADGDLIERLAAAISRHVQPRIPISHDLWSAKEVAAYLKITPEYFLTIEPKLKDFPCQIRLAMGTRRGHPLYKAAEVIRWAMAHMVPRKGTPKERL